MKRAFVVIVVLLLLLLVVDVLLRAAAENAAAKLIDKRVTQKGEPEVGFDGFPFLLSALRGRFERITIDVASASEGPLVVEDIHLTLEDVEVEALATLRGDESLRARTLKGRGVISERTLNQVLADRYPGVRVDVEDANVLVSRSGVSASANAVVAGNRLLISAGEVMEALEIPLPALLPEVRFTSLRAQNGRLVLGAAASQIRIRP